ncbi:MAG TPA: hypothetical protein VJA94_16680 [Candidatus Angelobacter sp.]
MTNHAVGTIGDRRVTLQRLDGFAWGLFFIWIGIALLANLSWGIGLLGVGILVLTGQMVRKSMAAGLETFWVLVGLFFVTGGIWMLLGVRISLMPIFSIAAGLAILISALFGKPGD